MTRDEERELECEGGCPEHVGQVRKVVVNGAYPVTDWEFNYCESAINYDKDNGFDVKDADL